MTSTIAAISTAPGTGAIAVIRLSGPDSLGLLRRVFFPKDGAERWTARSMRFGQVRFPDGGLIDEALAVWFPGPKSFTGEDCAEIHGHGGEAVSGQVLAAVLAAGAALAEPGEFTRRAFFNGRLDLSQAEAVADLISAQSAAEVGLAARQLAGGLSQRVEAIHQAILSGLVELEAAIDFNEDVEPIDMSAVERRLRQEALLPLMKLLDEAGEGRLFKDGLKLALVGAPNVGKSSLFNALAGHDRALVSDVAGTTRDFITIGAIWSGLRIELCDTAGLSETPCDALDALGQERTRDRLEASDIVLWVRDCGRFDGGGGDYVDPALMPPGRTIVVWNKIDLAEAPPKGEGGPEALAVSARTGRGLDLLKSAILKLATGRENPSPPEVVPNLRHQAALKRAESYLSATFAAINEGQPPDICAFELRAALDSIGLICGRTSSEDLLNEIFTRFCLGK
ncbi:tRNA uridine-5-carboxymethylaminomethyl(34) synthesis GTPase MnmE [Deltaproteobacteria bacterium Smac51]|nr:tRNA uridine-5-carboxymethylaminomethyl(34) synthesis GTPase MnmE [Deltaproteobacteria bacterium Smac51]